MDCMSIMMNVSRVAVSAQTQISRCSRLFLSDRARYLTSQYLYRPVPTGSEVSTTHFQQTQWPNLRSFSTTSVFFKKGGKAAREEKQSAAKSSNGPPNEDPFDFSGLESEIASILERLKSDLSKLRAGGRFNPESVENLRVQPEKDSKQTVKLNDLAQVIPKGRTVQILVGEKDHVKPVSSAIQSSSLSLTPQPDPTGANPLMLVLAIPPPTADSRKAAVNDAAKAGEKASTAVRDARGKQQKKLRALQLSKAARPDDLKKAGTMMEKVVEKGAGEVKKVAENAKKVLESG